MLQLKYKKLLDPFIDSEKQVQNVFKRILIENQEIPASGSDVKIFTYMESKNVTNSYYSLDNEKTQLASPDYFEYNINNQNFIKIKHSQKTKNFRQGVELNNFIRGTHGWQASGIELYDSEIGQLNENSIKKYFEESNNNQIFIDGFDDENFDVCIENSNGLSFDIINKSGIIEPLAIRDSYIKFQENIPLNFFIYNFIKGTIQSGENLIIENSSNQFDINYKEFSPYYDLFENYVLIGNEKLLLNNNTLNELNVEKVSILGNDDFYFENIGSIAFCGLKYFNIHKTSTIEISIDHQTEYWGHGDYFSSPLSSSVYIITETTGSGRNVNITGYGTGHAQIYSGSNLGTNYPSGRFEFSIGYNTAPSYINPEIKYAGYYIGTALHPNISGVYLVPDETTYYNIPIIFTDHNNSIIDPSIGHGLTIDIIIRKSFIANVKINNFGNNYPKGEFRYGINENALFPGSQKSTGIGILKIK